MKREDWRLIVALFAVFGLGIVFAVGSGIYAQSAGSALPIWVYALCLASALTGAGIVFLFKGRIAHDERDRFLRLLPGEERRVIEILLEHDGSCEQNRIVAESTFSKVRVSRILASLEAREAVARTRMGMTKLVVLRI